MLPLLYPTSLAKTQSRALILTLTYLNLALMAFSLKAEVITVQGVLSNNVYFVDHTNREIYLFEASSDGFNSSIDTTNASTQISSHIAWISKDRYYSFQSPKTNSQGGITNLNGGRVDHGQVPSLDGTYYQCIWLAFGSHSYFTGRSNSSALPIWPTGLRPADDEKIGTKAFYTGLQNSFFPSEVAYVTDGYEHFYGSTGRILQGVQLRPPLDQGFTNYIGRATAVTNINGREVPLRFEILRYGPVLNGVDQYSKLKPLMYCIIDVSNVVASASHIKFPVIKGGTVVMDTRGATATSEVQRVYHTVSRNIWPTMEETERNRRQQQQLIQNSRK